MQAQEGLNESDIQAWKILPALPVVDGASQYQHSNPTHLEIAQKGSSSLFD